MPILDQLKDPKLLPLILGGAGAAGLAGGVLTARTPQGRNETPGGKRMRILKNALLAAGAGGGAVALGGIGANSFQNALPEGDVDPVTQAATSIPTRLGAMATTRGLLGLGASGEQSRARGILADSIGKGTPELRSMLGKGINSSGADKLEGLLDVRNTHTDTAGLNLGELARKRLADIHGVGDGAAKREAEALLSAGLSPSHGARPINDMWKSVEHSLIGKTPSLTSGAPKYLKFLRSSPRTRTLASLAAFAAPEVIQGAGIIGGKAVAGYDAVKDKVAPPPTY